MPPVPVDVLVPELRVFVPGLVEPDVLLVPLTVCDEDDVFLSFDVLDPAPAGVTARASGVPVIAKVSAATRSALIVIFMIALLVLNDAEPSSFSVFSVHMIQTVGPVS